MGEILASGIRVRAEKYDMCALNVWGAACRTRAAQVIVRGPLVVSDCLGINTFPLECRNCCE